MGEIFCYITVIGVYQCVHYVLRLAPVKQLTVLSGFQPFCASEDIFSYQLDKTVSVRKKSKPTSPFRLCVFPLRSKLLEEIIIGK